MTHNKIIWKNAQYGAGASAYCGGVKIGYIRPSLSSGNEYFVGLTINKIESKNVFHNREEAKSEVEKMFGEIFSKFVSL